MSPASAAGCASVRIAAVGIERCSTAGTTVRRHASCSCSSSSDGGSSAGPAAGAAPQPRRPRCSAAARPRAARRHVRASAARRAAACRDVALLEPVEAEGQRLAREIRARPRHLHERQLERQARVAALPHVLDRDVQQVDQPDDRRRAELVRLLAQPLARLVGDRQRLGHLARVLHEHQVAQVLQQVEHQPAEVLALLGELLQEDERAGRVAVDDEVAQPEQHLLLDRAEQLQHVLHRDRAARRGGELVERRDRVAERAARRPRDQAERAVGHVHRLAVGHPAQQPAGGRAAAGAGRRTSGSASAPSAAPSASSVVQKTKSRCGGGSSISFSSAFHAASVSWCASSRM